MLIRTRFAAPNERRSSHCAELRRPRILNPRTAPSLISTRPSTGRVCLRTASVSSLFTPVSLSPRPISLSRRGRIGAFFALFRD
jgi:hypothetical protein